MAVVEYQSQLKGRTYHLWLFIWVKRVSASGSERGSNIFNCKWPGKAFADNSATSCIEMGRPQCEVGVPRVPPYLSQTSPGSHFENIDWSLVSSSSDYVVICPVQSAVVILCPKMCDFHFNLFVTNQNWNGTDLFFFLMFADDICVFCPSVRWLQRILDVCQTYAQGRTPEGLRGLEPPLNGNRLNTNLLLTFVKT